MRRMQKAITSFVLLTFVVSILGSFSAVFAATAKEFAVDTLIEAESTSLGGTAEVIKDKSASGGKYITTSGKKIDDASTQEAPNAQFTVNIPSDGNYAVYAKVIVISRGNDSFHCRWDEDNWRTENPGEQGAAYVWLKLGEKQLTAGKHSFCWMARETGAIYDAFFVTTDKSKLPIIAGGGTTATTAPSSKPSTGNIVAKQFTAEEGSVMVEAEDSVANSKLVTIDESASASGKKAVTLKVDDRETPSQDSQGGISFEILSDKGGTYNLWVRKVCMGNGSDAIWISINGGNYKNISITVGSEDENDYQWSKLTTVPVTAGVASSVRIMPREKGSIIDKFIVTNVLGYTPTDLGELPVPGEVPDVAKLDESLYPKPEFTPPEQHPRLYFTKDDIPQILENAKKPQNQAAWTKYQEDLSKDIAKGVLPAPAKEGTTNFSSAALGTIEALAFNYVTEGNEENGKKAIEAIQNFMETVAFASSDSDTYSRNGGQAIFTLAEVYDWCYPLLSQDDMKHMINLAVANAQGGMEIGWPPVKQSAVVTHGSEAMLLRDLNSFAIAVYNERPDIYNVIVGRFMAEYVPARKFYYTSNMFNQGTAYGGHRGQWDFDATWIFDRLGQSKIFGDDQQATAYWFLYMRRPDGQLFKDGDTRKNGFEIGNYVEDLDRVMMLIGNYYHDPYLKQEAMRSNKNLSTFSYGHGGMTPVEFLCFNDPELEGAPLTDLPLTKYFGSPEGAMIARTGWNDGMDSPDAIAYMKVKELWFANHDHLDAGSFQLYYKGLLATDSGRYQGYGTEQDVAYNKRSIAHNTISVYDPNEISTAYLKLNDGGQEVKSKGTQFNTIEALLKDDQNKTGEVKGHEFGPDTQNPEYTYLKGDITKAYNASKMEDYERSFMFLNLENNENPAALVVFDRVRSSDASFKKAWLLHGPTEPEINGNRTVFRNNENGYNGKMTVDTLLPKADNTEITSIGGAGKEAWVQGKNYSAGTELDMTKTHESDGYRIEVSPKQSSKQDYFLNVLQVGDCEPDAPALESTLIETDTRVGAKIADRVVMFALDKGRTKSNVEFSFEGDGTCKIMVADMEAGTYKVYRDGNEISTAVASEEGGLLNFEGEAGAYKIVYADASADKAMVKSEPTYNEGITIRIANEYIYTDVAPTIIDDRTLVPMRVIFEKLGANIEWDNDTQTVTGTKKAKTIKLSIDDKNAYVDGKTIELDVPAMLINDRTMVPIRFVAESLNCVVDWDDFAKTVLVSKPKAFAFDENGNIYYTSDAHDIDNSLPIYGLAQGDSDGNDIENSVDGDFDTRWATSGDESVTWGTYDLGAVKNLDKAYLSFYNGNQRVYTFSLAVSEDGQNYTTVIDKQNTSGKKTQLEAYDMKGAKGRYIKFIGGGNTVNAWNSLTEIVFTEKK